MGCDNVFLFSYEAALEVGLGDVTTLVSATDGNHGFGLAHVGKLYGLKVKVREAAKKKNFF